MTTVLFSIGSIPIYTTSFFLSLAFLSFTFIVWREGRKRDFEEEKLLDLALLSTLGGLFAGRIFYILAHPALFHALGDYFFVWKVAGISLSGAVFGAVVSSFFILRKNHWPEAILFDILALGWCFGLALYELGIFLSGSGYGIKSMSVFATPFLGLPDTRLPLSLFGSIFFLVLFILLKLLHSRGVLKKGRIFSFGVISAGIVFVLFYFLEDHAPMSNPTLTLLSRLAIIMVGFGFLYRFSQRSLRKDGTNLLHVIRSKAANIKTRKGRY